MEGGVRSGGFGGAVEKSKSGSGCLLVENEGDVVRAKRSFQPVMERKSRRIVSGDLESSEELDEYCVRRGADKESGFLSRRDRLDQDESLKAEDDLHGKKRKLDVFEFDEYDRFDENLRMKKDSELDAEGSEDDIKLLLRRDSMRTESGSATIEGGEVIVYKRRNSFNGGSIKLSSVKNKSSNQSTNRNAYSLFNSKSIDASIVSHRVQGKNGVLKVPVNKSKGSDLLKTTNRFEAEDYKTPRDDTCTVMKGNQMSYSSSVLEARFDDQASSVGRTGKAFLNLHKSMSTRSIRMHDSGFGDSDTSSKSERDLDSPKAVSRKQIKRKTATPAVSKSRDERSKRGGGTEKQKLREHIKQMLLDAGWTIDYRPRRNKSYNDAVYVNTSGTSYWSIVKAYAALQKEAASSKERIASIDESSFSPLPETILCKLTRTTRQKLEKEKKIKHHKNGRSGRLRQASARRFSKAKYESEETTSDEETDFEEEEDEEEEEDMSPFAKKWGKSLKAANDLDCNSGKRLVNQYLHDEDLVCGDGNNNHLLPHTRKNKKLGRCTLLVRSTNKGVNPNDGYVPYTGKRTLLSWLIDCGTVELSEKIRYMNRTHKRTLQQGWITRDGIHCVCCSKIVTIENFEIHAGSELRQPFHNIITETGDTLLHCMLQAWNQQAESAHNYFHNVDVDGDDPNDDTCSICGDGGDLICCDGCPSTFHQKCLGIEVLPAGDWHCPQCICIHCGVIDGSDVGSDTSDVGSDTSKCALQTCSLCEMKYHFTCLKEVDSKADNSIGSPFCGTECEELHKILQKSIGVRNELEDGFSWTLIRRTIVDSNESADETPQKVECNAKLTVAQTIMDECFLPIVDRRSQVNLIHNVLYNCGSNFNRLNYEGFYTAILEKGDEIVSAASLRFHGTQFAEMPFIGTRHIYRRQGMCRRLFSAIESVLGLFKVEKLVIPAISELLQTWTKVFGFNHLEQCDKEKLRSFNMLVFPGIDMLQKVLTDKNKSEDEAVIKTGLFNTNKVAPDSMCQDPGLLINDSSLPYSPLDDKHTCSKPRNGIIEYMNESSFPNDLDKTCVNDGIVTNKKASAPDSSGTTGSHHMEDEELIHTEDKKNTVSEIKSEEMKPIPEYEINDQHVNANADMDAKLVSESVAGIKVQSVEDDDNHNTPGVYITYPDSLVGCVELLPSNCAVPTNCTDSSDLQINSRPCSEQCVPLHPASKQSLAGEVISDTPTHQVMAIEENSSDLTVCVTESTTLPLPTSNGDIIMDDAEVQKAPCDNFSLKEKYCESQSPSDAAAAESVLYPTSMEKDSHNIASPISTKCATVACIAPDEDVSMISLPDTDTFAYTATSEMINDGQTFSNRVGNENGTESLVTLKTVSEAAEQPAISSANGSIVADGSEA